MSENPIEQVLSDLLPYFEAVEAQSAAMLQLMRDKQIATEEELNRYLDQARDASGVKWRAARVRMEHLFAVAPDPTAKPKTEADTKKEVKEKEVKDEHVKRNSDESEVEPKATPAEKPTIAASAKVNNRSHEDSRASEKAPERPASDKLSSDAKGGAGAKLRTADEKRESNEQAEKDAA
jgi:hypothetical protein